MSGTFGRIETLFRGLQAQQRALDVTNSNIANANTPGYSRQVAMLVTTPPYTVPAFNSPVAPGQIGTGVVVGSIQRQRDGLLDLQYRDQVAQSGGADARRDVYGKIESVFGEPSDTGLNAQLNAFWQSWGDLANKPDDAAARQVVIAQGVNLATALNAVREQVATVGQDAAKDAALQVDRVNSLARQIAALNQQIPVVITAGQQPNDLMDARDQLVDQLSKLVGVYQVTTPDGALNLYIGGRPLVDHGQTQDLGLASDGPDGTLQLIWKGDEAAADAQGGSISGLIDMTNTVVPGVLRDLSDLRDAIAGAVNAQHRQGYGLNDPASPPNRDFFEVLPNGDLRVRDEIINDPARIAASSGPGLPGNNDNAIAIGRLQHLLAAGGGTVTINDFYNALVTRVGSETQSAGTAANIKQALVQRVDQQRQQVSGVSLDEEASRMIEYQRAYQAAARAMTVVDEMLDKLINSTGLVGR